MPQLNYTAPANILPTPDKKKRKKRVTVAGPTKEGKDAEGNTVMITTYETYIKEYTPPESEEDEHNPEIEAQVDKKMASAEAPEGARRSGREKSDNLKRAYLKNEIIVSNTLKKLD